MPIQLRAACDPVRIEALFSEGSSGEYEASARKRRSAETHSRNPASSFSRRFLLGDKNFRKKCHGAGRQARERSPCDRDASSQSLIIMTRIRWPTIGKRSGVGELGTGRRGQLARRFDPRNPRWANPCTARSWNRTGAFSSHIQSEESMLQGAFVERSQMRS